MPRFLKNVTKAYLLSSALVLTFLLGLSLSASAQNELTLLAPGSIRPLGEIVPKFEQKTGKKVKVTFGTGGGTKQQVAKGEAFDVAVLQPPFPEVLSSGHVVANSATPLATVAMGVAVKKGAPKPDISSAEAVKRTLLAAKSISFSDPKGAASGVRIMEMFQKLGIADQMQPKIKLTDRDPLDAVAKGEAELGVIFMVDMNNPETDVVGALPRDVSPPTAFVGFVTTHAKDPVAAKALLDFLASPEAGAVYKSKGMQPGS